MRTERERLAQELRAEGNEIAEEIRANADKGKDSNFSRGLQIS